MLKSLRQFARFLHCKGCGTNFQTHHPEKWGFKQQASLSREKSFRGLNHQNDLKIYENLTPAQQAALQFTPPELEIESISSAQVITRIKSQQKQAKFDTFCRPCIDSMEGRKTPIEPSQYNSLDKIAPNSKVMHVVDAYDFPASLEPTLTLRANTHFVISRADLVLTHPNQASRLKEYAMDQVFNKAGVPASHVHVVSTTKKWGLNSVYEALEEVNCFVGKTNCGKSTLVNAICGDKANIWPLPFKTQFPISSDIPGKKLVDMPSLAESSDDNGQGIFALLKPGHIRKISRGKMMLRKNNRYNVEPTVAKPKQTVSIGGLVAIEIPESQPGNATHVWAVHGVCGPQVTRALGSIEKIPEISKSTHPAHQGWSLTESTENFVHRFTMDATNTVALVVRGLGPVFIKSFGKYPEGNNIQVSSLPGVEVYKRVDILPWILHRKSKRSV